MNICILLNRLKDIHVYDVDVQKMLMVAPIRRVTQTNIAI